VRTLDQQRPRMVKRRNSSYAPHKRDATKSVCDFTPRISTQTGRRAAPPRERRHSALFIF